MSKKVQVIRSQGRQGDVLLMRVPESVELPVGQEVKRDHGNVVLAYGEVTGHSHAIADKAANFHEIDMEKVAQAGSKLFGELGFKLQEGDRLLETSAPVSLRHEEHGTIPVSDGKWVVRIQREYRQGAIQRVAD